MLSNLQDIPGTERSYSGRPYRRVGPEQQYPGFLSTTVIRDGEAAAHKLRTRTHARATHMGRPIVRALATLEAMNIMDKHGVSPLGSVPVRQFDENLVLVYLSTKKDYCPLPAPQIAYSPKRSLLEPPLPTSPMAGHIIRQAGLTTHLIDAYTSRRHRKLPAHIIAAAIASGPVDTEEARAAACDPDSMIMYTTDGGAIVSAAIARWRSPVIYSGTGQSSVLRVRELSHEFGPTQELRDATLMCLEGCIASDLSSGKAPLDAFCYVSAIDPPVALRGCGWQLASLGMESFAPRSSTALAA